MQINEIYYQEMKKKIVSSIVVVKYFYELLPFGKLLRLNFQRMVLNYVEIYFGTFLGPVLSGTHTQDEMLLQFNFFSTRIYANGKFICASIVIVRQNFQLTKLLMTSNFSVT